MLMDVTTSAAPVPGRVPQPGERVHLVGIGGAGMSGLARVLHAMGVDVSGSDRQASDTVRALRAEGIPVAVGHARQQLPSDCRLVVRSPAIPDDNPELTAARERGIPITKRAHLLGDLMATRIAVAVAGTHGKTTTSAWLAHVLTEVGADPSFFVGGEIPSLGTNARWGAGPHMVVEADEYDRTFHHGTPDMAVITNVEHDHPDIYPDLDAVVEAFRIFAEGVAPDGTILAWAGSRAAHRALTGVQRRMAWYAVAGDPVRPDDLDWSATDLSVDAERQSFELSHRGRSLGRYRIALPGRHNVANATAVVAIADALGLDRESVRSALGSFDGAGRRFELAGTIGGVTLIDDYAHHPTEIRATLAAAREHFPDRPTWAVIEPHTYSRVAAFADDFAGVLSLADRTFVLPIYAARESVVPGLSAAALVERARTRDSEAPPAQAVETAELAEIVAAEAAPGTVVVLMGAGDVTETTEACVEALRVRVAAQLVSAAQTRGLEGEILGPESLAKFTTLRVGGPAPLVVRVRRMPDLEGWWTVAGAADQPALVVGRGSNILVSDAGVAGLAIVNRCEAWELTEDDGTGTVTAESGVTLAALAAALARQGWAGLEAGIGIPGSVGAAVVTNAGAHDWDMAASLLEARILDSAGDAIWRAAADLEFGYRSSALKGRRDTLVTHVRLTVTREDPEAIQSRMAALTARRRATQPTTPSVGSMFKNPPGDYAGRLIEAAGLKGLRRGGAEISSVHANFFVNLGGATAEDIRALVATARRAVAEQFGVDLELEIEPWGWSDVQ